MAAELDAPSPDAVARADLLLLAFPLVFAAVYGGLLALADDGVLALAGASAACCLLIVDGIVFNPPVEA